jgi:hypothetical protein
VLACRDQERGAQALQQLQTLLPAAELELALLERLFRAGTRLMGQSAAKGALPTLFAATAEDVPGGAFYGPDGIG